MIVIFLQHRDALTAAERAMVAGMRDLPGLLLVNALVTNGRRTREIDGIWLHPRGAVAIEAKGTRMSGAVTPHANGPWTVDGAVADFPSGPNPLLQARTGAQALRARWREAGCDAGFIPAVVAISGTDLALKPQTVANTPVLRCEDLSDLPDLVAAGGRHPITAATVTDLLSALELSPHEHPNDEELAGEGFTAGPESSRDTDSPGDATEDTRAEPTLPTAPSRPAVSRGAAEQATASRPGKRSKSRDVRRARRFADLEERANTDWRRMHRRRVVASALAAVTMLGYLPRLPLYCTLNGLLLAAIVAALQMIRRRRLSGPRDSGPTAVLLWLLTLFPVVGVGASLSWAGALPAVGAAEGPFVILLSILLGAGHGCAVVAGRSAFVYPPSIVIERHDAHGRPTGAFMLAKADPLHFPSRDWKPVSPEP